MLPVDAAQAARKHSALWPQDRMPAPSPLSPDPVFVPRRYQGDRGIKDSLVWRDRCSSAIRVWAVRRPTIGNTTPGRWQLGSGLARSVWITTTLEKV